MNTPSFPQMCGPCGAVWAGVRIYCPECRSYQPIKLAPVVIPTSSQGWPWVRSPSTT